MPATAPPPDRSPHSLLGATSAGAVAGVALWVSLGVLTLESASPRAPRLGVLPHPWVLAAAVVGFAAAAYSLQRFSRLRRVSGWFYPLFCTGIVALPWLPVRMPAATLVWAGPAAWWVWGGVVMALVVILARSTLFARPAVFDRCLGPSRAGWTAAALAVVVYGGAAIYLSPVYPGGDEPHYLVITQSLLKDQDLKIENNHQRQDYLEYFQASISPHYLKRGLDGEIYSVHAPGLPALLLPAFWAGGYPGAVAFLVAIAALLSALVWHAAFMVSGRSGAAWFGWAAVMLSTPVLFHAFAVYPETIGATAVMVGVATLAALDRASGALDRLARAQNVRLAGPLAWSWWRWLLIGASLAVLPWLHTRYAVLVGVVTLALAGRLVGRTGWPARLLALIAVPAASAAAWFGFFKLIYGTFSPAAPYGHYTQTQLAYAVVGLQGLLFDQQFGLMPTAPVLMAALVGFVAVIRTRRRLAVELFVLVVSYAVAAAAYRMWWGGWSAPARLVVAVLPALAIPAAVWWNSRRAAGRLAGGALLGLGILLSGTELVVGRGSLIFNPRDAVSRLYEWLSPLVEVNRALPTLFRPEAAPPLLLAAVWVSAVGAGVAAASWAIRRLRVDNIATRCAATVAAVAVVVMVSLEVGWRIQGVQPIAGAVSRVSALEAAARPARIGVSYRPLAIEDPARLVTRLRLSQSMRRARRGADPAFQLAPVPPGFYRLDDRSLASVTTRLMVRIGRGESPVQTWLINPATRTAERTLRLPCAVNAVIIDADAAGRTSASRLALQPLQAWPGDGCPAARAHRGVRYGGATVLFFDTSAYPEERGFWVRGRAEATVAVIPDVSSPAVELLVRGGATELHVGFASGTWQSTLALQPGAEQVIRIPVNRSTGAAVIRISPDNGFVPSTVDPASRDSRFLGCWVTIPE